MSQTTQFDADVAAVEPEMPVTFRIDGKEFTGQRTPIVDRQQMVDAGFEQTYDFTLIVRVSAFAAKELPTVQSEPEIFDSIKGEWTAYRIVSAAPSQDGVTVEYAVRQLT